MLKELSGDYREVTKSLTRMDEFLKLGYEAEERHASVTKTVYSFLSDMKKSLDDVLYDSKSGFIGQLMHRVVGFVMTSLSNKWSLSCPN